MSDLTLPKSETLDSREVALMVGKDHAHLMRDIRVYVEFLDGSENPKLDSLNFFIPNTYKVDGNNKTYDCYRITKMGCEMIANKLNGRKGILFTASYVNKFNELERAGLKEQAFAALPDFTNPIVAARAWADQVEQKEIVIKQLEEAKPQILFSQAVATSSNSVLIGELAKILKQNGIEIGQNRLFEWLRQNEYLGKSGNNRNLPTQKAMKLGLFEIKKTSVSHSNGRIEIVRTPKVTGKGQIYIVEKFLSSKWKTLLSKKCLSNDL